MAKTPGVYKRGEKWRIAYRDQHGRQHFETVRTYRQAVKARTQRLAEVQQGKFRLRKQTPTLREFVESVWRNEVALALKPSTRRGYETALRHHLLPAFGDWRLDAISRGAVKAFIASKAKEQRWAYSREPNPNRPRLSRKTLVNLVGLLASILEVAATDYELIPANPLRGILRRKNFPADLRPDDNRVRFLEPGDFRRAVECIRDARVRSAVLFAALTGLRWSEQVAVRIEEDVDLRRNKLKVSRSLYRRVPQPPKSRHSVEEVDLVPTVRRILQAVSWSEGYIFSIDGQAPLGDGSWVKRSWRKAQLAASIRRPIAWHDLRHEFVCLLIAAGKHPKYIATQARHHSAGFTLDRYGGLFDSIPTTPVEWIDDLIWPSPPGNKMATLEVPRGQKRVYEPDERIAGKPDRMHVLDDQRKRRT